MKFPFLFGLLLLTACAPKELGPPPVDTAALIPLLADLQMAESLVGEVPIQVRDSIKKVYYDLIFADHQTDLAHFDSLMWILRQEPAWLGEIFSQVSDELATREAEDQRQPQKVKSEKE